MDAERNEKAAVYVNTDTKVQASKSDNIIWPQKYERVVKHWWFWQVNDMGNKKL